MLYIGYTIDDVLEQPDFSMPFVAGIFTLMVFLCATQDIAVDGWAISLLTDENKTYASTAQTIGLNTGYFMSFTIFLAFNEPEFCNKYIRSIPSDKGMLSLGSYLFFWGIMFLLANVCLLIFKTRDPVEDEEETIASVYMTIKDIIALPHMRQFLIVSLVCKIGWQAHEAVTGFKLMELGFKKEYLAMTALLDFPLQILFGYYAAKWSSGSDPLRPWAFGYYGRLSGAFLGMLAVYFYPKEGLTTFFFVFVLSVAVFVNFASTIQFVCMGSYFSKIADPRVGGTYMTLLNTMSNFGGTWPKYFVMMAVDYFTDAPCSTDSTLKCLDDPSKAKCKSLGGVCNYKEDGFYLVNTVCLAFGLLAMLFYIRPVLAKLQRLPDSAWRLKSKSKSK